LSREVKFTYGGDPSASAVDAVRFLVGDVDPDMPLLDDREVAWAIARDGSETLAAASLAEHLYGVFAGKADIKVGPVSKSFSKLADAFKNKARQLRDAHSLTALPSFPATSISAKGALECDGDLARPEFFVGLSDSPGVSQINDFLKSIYDEY